MFKISKKMFLVLGVPAMGAAFPLVAQADEPVCYFESRSGVNVECGIYHSEIGNSDAYVQTVVNRDDTPPWGKGGKKDKKGKRGPQPVILDVRSTPEYRAGHPEHSYNVPYPYIFQYCVDDERRPDGACKTVEKIEVEDEDGNLIKVNNQISQNVADFVAYVESIVPDKDTPIFTMCRTGVRSVGAANRLTEAGYTNVRNMWEGFVGIYLKAPQVVYYDDDGNPIIDLADVDLNHDGEFTDEDKNGWRYHQGLPYETSLQPYLIYWPYKETYNWD